VVELDGAHATLSWRVGPATRRGAIALPSAFTWTSHRGEDDPVAGWYSPRFGTRVPATSLIGRGNATSTTSIVTEVELP
jgi:hypothetical protein